MWRLEQSGGEGDGGWKEQDKETIETAEDTTEKNNDKAEDKKKLTPQKYSYSCAVGQDTVYSQANLQKVWSWS